MGANGEGPQNPPPKKRSTEFLGFFVGFFFSFISMTLSDGNGGSGIGIGIAWKTGGGQQRCETPKWGGDPKMWGEIPNVG